MEKQLTQRRYLGNEEWSNKASLKHSLRTKSTRSLRIPHHSTRSSQITTNMEALTEDAEQDEPNNIPLEETLESLTTRDKFEHMFIRLKATLMDQWRRATQSGNDPYVKLSLKPAPDGEDPPSFSTLPILGGGSNVEFHPQHDNGEYTFLCGADINALRHKYLKIEVFDKETGAADRLIGTAHVILKRLKDTLGRTSYQNEMALYGGVENNYQWSGTIDIEATFRRISNDEAMQIRAKNEPLGLMNKMNSNKKGKKGRVRAETDVGRIILKRTKTNMDVTALETEMQQQLEKEAEEKQIEKQKTKAHIIQGFIVDFVLFVSLVMSGTMFLGVMNVYEVDAQTQYMQENFGTSLTIIDTFRFSIVTVTTVGYGDFYPQTAGGKVFGSFMIIFGVSLLARLLSTILDTAARNYEAARLRRITNRRAVTHDSMSEFDEDDDGIITQYEFLKTMLLRRGDTDITVIEEIMRKFDEYDEDQSGEIEVKEIKELIKKKKQKEEEKEEKEEEEENKKCCWCFAKKKNTKERAHTNPEDEKTDHEEEEFSSSSSTDENMDTDMDLLSGITHYNEESKESEYEYALIIRAVGCDDLREADSLVAAEDSFWSFIKGWFGFMLYLMIGAAIFSLIEDVRYADMFWFFIVTTCTVGYGDVNPKSQTGRILNTLFISISVVLFVSTFSSTFDYLYARQEALMKEKTTKKRSMDDMIKNFPLLHNALKKRQRKKKKEKQKKKLAEKQDNDKTNVVIDKQTKDNDKENNENSFIE